MPMWKMRFMWELKTIKIGLNNWFYDLHLNSKSLNLKQHLTWKKFLYLKAECKFC